VIDTGKETKETPRYQEKKQNKAVKETPK